MPEVVTIPKPFCEKGKKLSAKRMNDVADVARRFSVLPDSFISSALLLQTSGGVIEFIRLAICTLEIPQAEGGVEGPITPGCTFDENDTPIANIKLLKWSGPAGSDAILGQGWVCENYSPSGPITVGSGLFVIRRSSSVYVAISAFCTEYGAAPS